MTLSAEPLVVARFNAVAGGNHALATVPAGHRWIIRDVRLGTGALGTNPSSFAVTLLDATGNYWDFLLGNGSIAPNLAYALVQDGFIVLEAGKQLGYYNSSALTGQLYISGHDFEL